jgi:hypothetical protein
MAHEMADVWKQIAAELGRLLKPYGFAKAGLSFIDKHNEEVVREVRIEKFRWNTPGHQRFQLKLSLYLATGNSGEFTFKGQDAHYSLVFQESAGYLWGEEAFLYLVPETLPDEAFFAELRLHVTHYIVPFLQQCTSIDAVIDVLEQENRKQGQNFFSATLAVALARLGRKEESRKHFRQCLGDLDSIRKFAELYGIHLDD